MKVAELTAYHVRIPLRKAIRHASHARTETDNVLVYCALQDGSEGFGEGVPREYVTGESIDSALNLIRLTDLSAQLERCRDFASAVAMVERLRLNPVPGDDRACQGNAARCAVELALLDAYGRAFGEPLMTVTRLIAPELYAPRERVQYSGAITSARGLKATLAAWAMWGYGFKQLKVKVGIAGHDDVKRLRTIRKRAGRRMDIRIDANEAWPADHAADRIRELEPFGITSVEQPVAHAEAGRLPEIRSRVKTPIMLDESLCGMVDAERAADGKLCDLFNIRLSKCGGFIPSLRLARFARRHGLGYQLGCQVGETAVLSAAGRHFATSVDGIRYLEGSYDRHLVKESLGERDVTFGRGGWAPILVGTGLGVRPDPQAIERVVVRKEPILG